LLQALDFWQQKKKAASHPQPFCIASLAFSLCEILKERHGLRFSAAKLKRE